MSARTDELISKIALHFYPAGKTLAEIDALRLEIAALEQVVQAAVLWFKAKTKADGDRAADNLDTVIRAYQERE